MTDQTDNVIDVNFRIGQRKPEPIPLTISERTIDISGHVYTVRRTVEAHGGGFLTIRDAAGETVLVRSAAIPDEFVPDLIVAYRAGEIRGRLLGRCDAYDRMTAEIE